MSTKDVRDASILRSDANASLIPSSVPWALRKEGTGDELQLMR